MKKNQEKRIVINGDVTKPAMNATDIRKARSEEGKRINAYYQSRKEKTLW